jgi:hypothetical protein
MQIYQLRPELDVLVREVLLIVGALFPIVNPLGSAPIFLTRTRDLSSGQIAMNGFILLIVSMFIGTYLLAFFGISPPVISGRRRNGGDCHRLVSSDPRSR